MNQLRRAFIMAHLVKHGWIKRRAIQEAFGMSGRNATNDLTKFQELHGPLDREEGRSHVYRLPENYDTRVPLDEVSTAVTLINEVLVEPRLEQVTFRGVDCFNRPIFQSLKYARNFYGSCDKLFPSDAGELDVLPEVMSDDLTYFGSFFGCEPMGTEPHAVLEIVLNAQVKTMPKLHRLPPSK